MPFHLKFVQNIKDFDDNSSGKRYIYIRIDDVNQFFTHPQWILAGGVSALWSLNGANFLEVVAVRIVLAGALSAIVFGVSVRFLIILQLRRDIVKGLIMEDWKVKFEVRVLLASWKI